MRFRSQVALTLATLGVLVAIIRACLRPAAHAESQRQPAICAPALTPRVALVVVDALRADTFFGEAFASFRRAHPDAATGIVRTSPVSMSTAGVRSMATGTFPDLFDVLHNWDNVASELPSVPGLARAAGRDTELYGDSIWRELFPQSFVVTETEVKVPRIIFYLRAETLIDETRVKRLAERLRKRAPPDFLVVHLVGLDHAGHRRGVKSAGYADVARRIVAQIEEIVRLLPADTTVLLTSDHGATDSGGHGGGSDIETTAPLYAFGPGIVPGARVSINQIDLAPTLSCLLGLPVPAMSLGRPTVELFAEPAPARLGRLRAALSEVEQAWAKPTGVEADGAVSNGSGAALGAGFGDDARALDTRFSSILAAFTRNVARARAPVALWGLVLLVFLVARMGEPRLPRATTAVLVALALGAGIVLTAFPGRWSLPVLGLCLAAALFPRARADWERTRFASPAHRLWLASAAAALLLARARDHQGRRTTVLFGSPSDVWLVCGGAALCLVLRALERRVRAEVGERTPTLMLPIVFLAVMEGGDASIAIGNGFFAAWMLWDLAEGWFARREVDPSALLGALAQGGLLALYLTPRQYQGWIRGASVSTVLGAIVALGALAVLGRRVTARPRALSTVAVSAVVLAVELLRRGALGETAVELGLALLLAGFLGLAAVAWRRGNGPVVAWGMASVLVALWWLLCTPPQRLIIGLSVAGLVAFARAIARAREPAVAAALVGLALAFWRWGLVGHFEGEFGFGSLEISLAYVGNPGRHAPQGALTILLKAWLPLAVAAAVLATEDDRGRARAVLQATAFVVGARIVHLALATAFNPDSFYTMHRILGELTHQIVILIGLGLFSGSAPDNGVGAPSNFRETLVPPGWTDGHVSQV